MPTCPYALPAGHSIPAQHHAPAVRLYLASLDIIPSYTHAARQALYVKTRDSSCQSLDRAGRRSLSYRRDARITSRQTRRIREYHSSRPNQDLASIKPVRIGALAQPQEMCRILTIHSYPD